MTEQQARILYLVVQVARLDGWRVPTGEMLATLLRARLKVDIKPRTASDHLKRLQKYHDCFCGEKIRRVNTGVLCTEPDSALYLLALDKLSKNSEGRISRDFFHTLLKKHFCFMPQATDTMFARGKASAYIEEILADKVYIRGGRRTNDQIVYLELLAPKERLSLLDEEPPKNGASSPYGSVTGF